MNKILLLMLVSISLFGLEGLKVGSSINIFNDYEYESPKGHILKVPPKSKLVLVTFEKDTASLVNNYLKTQEKYYIQKNNAVFISDISNMPRFITNMFALPKMKNYKHKLYLQYSKKFKKRIPHKDDQITLIHFVDKKVLKISFVNTKESIKESIEK